MASKNILNTMVEKHNLESKKSHIKKIIERKKQQSTSDDNPAQSQDLQNELEELKVLNEELQANNKKLYNDLLLSAADKDNEKKKMERELKNARDYSVTKLAEKIVSELDSMEKALDSVVNLNLDDDVSNMVKGVEMTFRGIVGALQEYGVERIDPAAGDPFDHNMHQAIQTVHDDAYDNNVITAVLQCGYKIQARLLRAAMVVVSKKNV